MKIVILKPRNLKGRLISSTPYDPFGGKNGLAEKCPVSCKKRGVFYCRLTTHPPRGGLLESNFEVTQKEETTEDFIQHRLRPDADIE